MLSVEHLGPTSHTNAQMLCIIIYLRFHVFFFFFEEYIMEPDSKGALPGIVCKTGALSMVLMILWLTLSNSLCGL